MYVAIIESSGGPPFPPIHNNEGSEGEEVSVYGLVFFEGNRRGEKYFSVCYTLCTSLATYYHTFTVNNIIYIIST